MNEARALRTVGGRLARALAAFMLAQAALAEAALAQGQPGSGPELACDTWGHDVVVFNRSNEAIPAGTTIEWSVWDGKREGGHVLEADLEPFIGLYLISALKASYWDLRPCEVWVAQTAGQSETAAPAP